MKIQTLRKGQEQQQVISHFSFIKKNHVISVYNVNMSQKY